MTDEYTKMMAKSPLRETWKWKVGDRYWVEGSKGIRMIQFKDDLRMMLKIKNRNIPRPSSDDWWGMIEGESFGEKWGTIITDVVDWDKQGKFCSFTRSEFDDATSLQILLCLFVHKEKFNLEWDKEKGEWVK
jgi:hypothetical protein